jgi:hypothetical protein
MKCSFSGYKDQYQIQFQLPESWDRTQIKQLRRMHNVLHGACSSWNNNSQSRPLRERKMTITLMLKCHGNLQAAFPAQSGLHVPGPSNNVLAEPSAPDAYATDPEPASTHKAAAYMRPEENGHTNVCALITGDTM